MCSSSKQHYNWDGGKGAFAVEDSSSHVGKPLSARYSSVPTTFICDCKRESSCHFLHQFADFGLRYTVED